MRSKLLQLLVVPVLAGAMLLSGTNAAQAASATTATSQTSVEAKAISTAEAVVSSLKTTGTAVFTGADGTVHRMSLSGENLIVDGRVAPTSGPFVAAGWWCNTKVALAIAAITVVGAAGIALLISGLPAATTVAIAGFEFSVATWSRIAIILGSGGSLVGILQGLLC